jgi:hypothetical protein
MRANSRHHPFCCPRTRDGSRGADCRNRLEDGLDMAYTVRGSNDKRGTNSVWPFGAIVRFMQHGFSLLTKEAPPAGTVPHSP